MSEYFIRIKHQSVPVVSVVVASHCIGVAFVRSFVRSVDGRRSALRFARTMPPKKKPATTMKTPAKNPAKKAKASRGTGGRKTTAANNNKAAGAPKRRPAAATTGTTAATAAGTTTTVRGYWSENEEGALKRAVRKHGIGAWEKMRNDPEFATLRCVRCVRERPPI